MVPQVPTDARVRRRKTLGERLRQKTMAAVKAKTAKYMVRGIITM